MFQKVFFVSHEWFLRTHEELKLKVLRMFQAQFRGLIVFEEVSEVSEEVSRFVYWFVEYLSEIKGP